MSTDNEFNEGVQAYAVYVSGKFETHQILNPYPVGSSLWDRWLDGWKSAEAERQR